MKIDLTELLRHVGKEADVEGEEKVSFPEDGLNLTRPVKVKVHLTNTGTSVLVKGAVETEAELECSRCLSRFRLPLSVLIEEEYSGNPSAPSVGKKRECELKKEDFVYAYDKDNSLDLGETVRQNLLLALPIKPLCKSDCKGGF